MNAVVPKTLIVTFDYLPKRGGVANYLYGVAREFPEGKVAVLADKNLLQGDEPHEQHHIYYETMFSTTSFPKWRPAFGTLSRTVETFKPELLIVGNILPLGLVTYVVSRIHKIDYYVSLHGLDILAAQTKPRKRMVARFVLKHAKAIVVNSEYTKTVVETFLGKGGKPIIVVNPCPLYEVPAPGKSKEAYKEAAGYNADQLILLSVGRLVKRKGFHNVIAALPGLIKKVPDIKYIIVGSGPEERRLAELVARNGLENIVEIHTDVSDEKLARYYRLADIFVMPNYQIGPDVEGFGLVFIEANQYSLPTIGGRSGGVPEAIKDGKSGMLIEPNSVDAIYEAILKLANDKVLRQDMGIFAQDWVAEHFIWRHEVNKIVFAFNNL